MMIELLVNIPDTKQKLVEELIVELGGEVITVHKSEVQALSNQPLGENNLSKNATEKAIDHTYLFDKWKNFDIDIAKIREEAW